MRHREDRGVNGYEVCDDCLPKPFQLLLLRFGQILEMQEQSLVKYQTRLVCQWAICSHSADRRYKTSGSRFVWADIECGFGHFGVGVLLGSGLADHLLQV